MKSDNVSEALKAALLLTDQSASNLLANDLTSRLDKYTEKIRKLLEDSIPKNTRKAFKSDLNQFLLWWQDNGGAVEPFPISDMALAAYIANMQEIGKSRATILRSVSSISKFHTLQKAENPAQSELVKQVMKGITRTLDSKQKKAAAIGIEMLSTILDNLGSSWIDRRNAAILCIGWAAALRCSEMADLQLSDLGEETTQGVILMIRHSKTDQERQGVQLALPYSRIIEQILYWKNRLLTLYKKGPLFPRLGRSDKWFPAVGPRKGLSERAIAMIVKDSVHLIGLDSTEYSPHSLRAGFCTDAARYNVPEHIIQRHSRHVSSEVLRGYIREGNQWQENPLPAIFDKFFGPTQK